MNSFNFFLSGMLFICPSIPNDSFAGYSNILNDLVLRDTFYTKDQWKFLEAVKKFEDSRVFLLWAEGYTYNSYNTEPNRACFSNHSP